MANTPEAEEQEVQLGEQQLEKEIEKEIEEEIKPYVCPKCAKRVYGAKAEDPWEDDDLPSIKLIHTKNYSNVNRIAEHDQLMDKNWHGWKERMRQVFYNCDITGYITGDIKCPNEAIDPVGTLN